MKINLLKKVVVGGLITSLFLCCCFLNFNKNIRADIINDNSYLLYYDYYKYVNYSNINVLDDLYGTIWTLNYSFSSEENPFPTGLLLKYISNEDVTNILEFPFLSQKRNPSFIVNNLYHNDANINVFSLSPNLFFFLNNELNPDIQPFQYTIATICSSYIIDNDILINDNQYYNVPIYGSGYLLTDQFETTLNFDIGYVYKDFKDNGNWNESFSSLNGITTNNIYLMFPNSGKYTLELGIGVTATEEQTIEIIKRYFTQVTIENVGYNFYRNAYNNGYNNGYSEGFINGEISGSNGEYRFSFLTGILNAVSDVLALEIFPNVRLGYFVLIPLALGVTGMIFWFWRKD